MIEDILEIYYQLFPDYYSDNVEDMLKHLEEALGISLGHIKSEDLMERKIQAVSFAPSAVNGGGSETGDESDSYFLSNLQDPRESKTEIKEPKKSNKKAKENEKVKEEEEYKRKFDKANKKYPKNKKVQFSPKNKIQFSPFKMRYQMQKRQNGYLKEQAKRRAIKYPELNVCTDAKGERYETNENDENMELIDPLYGLKQFVNETFPGMRIPEHVEQQIKNNALRGIKKKREKINEEREERDFVKASNLIKKEFTHYLNYERQKRVEDALRTTRTSQKERERGLVKMVNYYEQIKHQVNRAKLKRQNNEDKALKDFFKQEKFLAKNRINSLKEQIAVDSNDFHFQQKDLENLIKKIQKI
ncbi:hypothetical protein ROZALSC1DRAFT_31734 [Rozella allomycis CSF55]|uniref:Uncharacterized protein n=1 Tax=Rozella allomycis (strain CSF55) TaxID=988480 RepID=A0A4P9YAJ5_ROZAC|nr:hypothetical protein ROZALSC1DRAFT_31734 [Rozella allomycis CSF55]